MKEEVKHIYRGKKQSTTVILSGSGFDPMQLPALSPSFVINKWNAYQVNDDGKISSTEIKILDYAYWSAEPDKLVVVIDWEFI